VHLLSNSKKQLIWHHNLSSPSLQKSLSLRANFTWTFFGNVIYAVSQWGMLTAMAKLGSPVMVGQFSLGTAICTPIIMFANLQLSVIQATDARDEHGFGEYLTLRLMTTIPAMLVIIGVAFGSGYRQETLLVILALGLAKAFEAVSDIMYGLMQRRERMDRIAISKSVKGPMSLLFLAGLIWATGSVLYGVLGLAAAWLAMLLLYDLPNARRLSPVHLGLGRDAALHIVRMALPLGIVMMLISLNANIPRYFVEHYGSERELGYYSAMAYLLVIGNMVVSALGQSATPRLAKYYAEGRGRAFGRLLLRLVLMGLALGVAGTTTAALLGRPVLALLYRPDYAAHADVLVWLMVAGGIGYVASFLGYGMSAARYFRVQSPLFAVVAISTAVSCFLLVPKLGLLGAAQATVVGAGTSLLGSLAVVVHAAGQVSLVPQEAPTNG
jgi:O-antigen/teichoic acid export membrane protein